MGAGRVLYWRVVSPTTEGPVPLKGQACKEAPKGLSMGTKPPSWEAVSSTGTARGEWGGMESIFSYKQTPASWLVTDSS